MAKVTEYSRITKMKDNDILLVDGPDGTRTILQTDAAKQMGGEVIMVNETAGDSTKVVINTTGEDVELATMADLEPVEEDVGELKTHLDNVNDAFVLSPNIFDINKITDGKYMSNTGNIGTNASYCYTDYMPVNPGDVLWFSTRSAKWYSFYDATKTYISGGTDGSRGQVTAPNDAKYVIMTFISPNYTGIEEQYKVTPTTMVNVGPAQLAYVPFGEVESLKKTKLPEIDASDISGMNAYMTESEFCDPSKNLINYSEITHGYYMTTDGRKMSNATYCYTNKMPVTPGDKLYWSESNARFITVYDSNGDVVSASGSGSETSSPYTIPANIYGVVLSLYDASVTSEIMCNTGASLLPYVPYGGIIKGTKLPKIPADKIVGTDKVTSLLGHNSLIATQSTLTADTAITVDSTKQPQNMRKNVGISFECDISTFGNLLVGTGYNKYRGKWIKIYSDKIEIYMYHSSALLYKTISHSLSIDTYIKVYLFFDVDGTLYISINSKGGTFTTSFQYSERDASANAYPFFDYEIGGVAFASCAEGVTNAKIAYTCGDINKPFWMFGDSYFGNDPSRVMGQLDALGFFRNVCVNSIGGIGASTAKGNLDKMLLFGTPKYIIWCLGMNGTDENSISVLDDLIDFCEDNDITLIAYKVPAVPNALHSDYDSAVEDSGLRYIDAYSAVGANSSGEWYTGYLSSDNVHPTELGAKAIAMQFLVDCPEIMQYGRNAPVQS